MDDLTSEYGSRKRRRLGSLTTADQLHEEEVSKASSEQRLNEALDKFASNMNRQQVNWKTGTYLDAEGNQRKLSSSELENLRRERNRMHAKMTRDRKKLFVASIEQAINKLESDNRKMRDVLSKHSKLASYCAEKERLSSLEGDTNQCSGSERGDSSDDETSSVDGMAIGGRGSPEDLGEGNEGIHYEESTPVKVLQY